MGKQKDPKTDQDPKQPPKRDSSKRGKGTGGKPGYPSKLTPEVHARLVSYVAAGAYKQHAAMACGISDRAYHKWVRRGETGEEPYATLLLDLRKAEGEDISETMKHIDRGARLGDWKAAAWKLERKYPDLYGQSIRHDVKIERGVEQVLDAVREHMSEAAYDELVGAIAGIQGLDEAQTEDEAAE